MYITLLSELSGIWCSNTDLWRDYDQTINILSNYTYKQQMRMMSYHWRNTCVEVTKQLHKC